MIANTALSATPAPISNCASMKKGRIVTRINRNKNHGMEGDDSTVAPPVAWTHIAFICLAVLAVYSNTFTMDFVWDDFHHIKGNTLIRSLSNIPRMFTTDVWYGSTLDIDAAPYYRPLFKVSLAFDYFLWKERAFGYHLTNVFLHMAVSVFVYLVSLGFLRLSGAALFAGLVFAVHPVHSEAVAWISARNELLCALFMLISYYLYLRFTINRRGLDLAMALTAFFVSLLAKEMSITLPAIILLHEVCFGKGILSKKLRFPIFFGLVAVSYLLLRAMVLEVSDWGNVPLSHRIFTSFGLIAEYLRLLALPAKLKVFYDIPMKETLFTTSVIAPLLLLLLVFAAALSSWRHDRRLFFSLFWIFLTLTIVSGIPALLAPALMAERYLYIPSIGFAIFAGISYEWAGKSDWVSRFSHSVPPSVHARNLPVLIGTPLLIILAFLNYQHNSAWENDQLFKSRWVNDAPNDAGGHLNLGVIYEGQGMFDEAVREYRKALHLRPDYVEAIINLGIVYDKTDRVNEAEKEYETALQLNPNFPELHYNLGMLYLRQNRFADAEREFLRVITLNPGSADSHNNLGLIYSANGQSSRAVWHLEEAVRLNPDNDLYRKNLADVLRGGRMP